MRHVLLPPVGNRFSTRLAPLRLLIQNAYDVNSFQIFGGPDWIDSSGYDIEAKAAGNPTRGQIWLMLRSLLEDRFKLRVHRETKLMPVYSLTVAMGGLNLRKATEGDCIEVVPVQGQRPLAPGGRITVAFEAAAGLNLEGGQVTMAELTGALSAMLGRPVVDNTGFSGKFDIGLGFAYEPDVTVGIGNPWRQGNSDQSSDPGINAPIAAALRRQLGLRLDSSKGPIEVLIIDHVEKPSKNY